MKPVRNGASSWYKDIFLLPGRSPKTRLKRYHRIYLSNSICHLQVENHGIDEKLMEKVKQLVNSHYEEKLKPRFYESDVAKKLKTNGTISDVDWESTFFIWHRPDSNINNIADLSKDLRSVNMIPKLTVKFKYFALYSI